MTSTYTFASPWALSPQGREELLQSFRKSESGAEAQFLPETSDAEVVSLRCTEQCFIDFVEFTSKFYDAELSRETDDIYEEPKLIRMSGTSAIDVSFLETQSVPLYEVSSPVAALDQLIQHEQYSKQWNLDHEDNQGRFRQILPTIIGGIERIAGIRLEQSLATITVFGDSEAVVDLAISKLKTLERSMARGTLTQNHAVLEAELQLQLRMIPMREIPDFRPRTTLLSPQSAHYKSLRNSHILVLMRNGEIGTIDPTVQIENSMHIWSGHHLTLQLQGIPPQSVTKATPILRWVDESNVFQVVDPFAPETKDESVAEDAPKAPEPKPSLKEIPSTKRVRKVKGATETIKAVELPSSSGDSGLKTPEPIDNETTKASDLPSCPKDNALKGAVPISSETAEVVDLPSHPMDVGLEITEPDSTEGITKAADLPSHPKDNDLKATEPIDIEMSKAIDLPLRPKDNLKATEPIGTEIAEVIDLPSRPKDEGLETTEPHSTEAITRPLAIEEKIDQQFQPPAIQPPFMPPPSIEPPRTWEREINDWEQSTILTSTKVGRLIDIGSPADSPQQKMASEHKMHKTMGQKKGQIIASEIQTVTAFNNRVREMLHSMSACREVKISVSIGRILVHRHTIPEDYRIRPFGIKEWSHATGHIQTEFTERLTTRSSDGSYIIGLKLPQSRRLFEESPSKRSVSYVIKCLTKNSEHIIIEVFEGGGYTVRGEKTVDGVINWHFPKRAWDACLQVTSHEFVGGQYSKEVLNFVKSLEISQAEGAAGLSFSVNSKGSNFNVQSMTLKRDIIHTATIFPDLQLHMTEVQELNVGQSTGDPDVFIATMAPQEHMVADHRLWWEASITSQHAENALKESETLELGDKSEWKPETVLEHGVVEDMYGLAQDIVTRIDPVGIGNKGPSKSGSKGTTKPSVKSHEIPWEAPTGTPGYW